MHYVLIPFAWLLRMLYHLFNNYGVALILFSLITKLILMPFTAKSKKSMMKTSRLGPKLKELEAKCGDDKMKYQQEMQALYKKEGVSPMSGCLWSLLPLVLLMALYYVIRQPMTYLMQLYMTSSGLVELATSGRGSYYTEIVLAQAVYDNMDAIKAIVPDIASRAIDFHFLGVDLSQIPTWRWMFDGPYTLVGFGLFIIPVVSAVSQFASMQISQKLNGSVATNDKGEKDQDAAAAAAQSMKTMMYVMPLFSLWIGFSMPAAMCIYWIAQAVFNTALDGVLTVHYKKVYDEEDELKRERAAEEAAIEAEKEARRAERRAMMPEGANPNTSRRKIKKQQKLAESDTPEGKFTEEERAEYHRQQEEKEKAKGGLSGDPNRPYSRGRAYDPNRYQNTGALQETPAEPEPEVPEDPTDPE